MAILKSARSVKGTFPGPSKSFMRYSTKLFDLIPLHLWDDQRKGRNGKVQELGKAPVHMDWTKRPYNSAKVRDAAIESGRNLGVRLRPDQIVIDVDPRNGGDEGFASLCHDLELDPDEWPRVITGSGGLHCYMTKPADVLVRDTLEGYPGVEFKTKGRQVVAAGSRHPNGEFYRWSEDHPRIEDGAPLIPTTLLDRIKRPARSASTGGGQYDQVQIAELLSKLDVEEFSDQTKWFQLMQACHHASNGHARTEFVAWSTDDPAYANDADIIGRRWDSLDADRDDGVTFKTLNMHVAKAGHGSALPPPSVTTDDFPDDLDALDFDTPADDDPDAMDFDTPATLPPMKWDMNELDDMLDYAEEAMAVGGVPLYQTAKRLVHPVRMERASDDGESVRRAAGALTTQDVIPLRLNQYMIRHAKFYRVVKAPKGASATRVKHAAPLRLAEHMLARPDRWRIPPLTGIIETPTLRADGSLLADEGYDVASGLLLDMGGVTFPTIADAPSRDDALAALKLLKRPLAGFPFVGDGPKSKGSASRSVMLSAMLTALVRRSLRSAPMHGFSAPTPGTGKTLAVQVAAVIATGHEVTAMSQGANAEEDEKRIFSVLMQGDQVVLIDNVTRPIGGNALCTILTEEFWQSRMLGFSRNASVATNVLMTASGNNLIFEGDMTRRALLCRMDAGIENPEGRSFDMNLKEWVPAHRRELVAAGLTVLRAFVVAGRPGLSKLSAFGSFEQWSNLIRGALVWLGEPDPCLTRSHIAADDPVKSELGEFLSAVHAAKADGWFTASELLAVGETEFEANADSLMEVIEATVPRASKKRLGQYLKSHERQIVGGLRLEVDADAKRKINIYRVTAG